MMWPLSLLKRLLSSGTQARPVRSGISGITKQSKTSSTGSISVSAKSAVSHSKVPGEKGSTALLSARLVASASGIRVTTVTRTAPSDVGCITVDDGESFCLANGAVVHNCYDALRYGVMRRRRNPNVDDVPEVPAQSDAEVSADGISFAVDWDR